MTTTLRKDEVSIGDVLESSSYKRLQDGRTEEVRVLVRVESLTRTGIPRLRLLNVNQDTLRLTNNREKFNAHVRKYSAASPMVYLPLYPPVDFRGVYVNSPVRIVATE